MADASAVIARGLLAAFALLAGCSGVPRVTGFELAGNDLAAIRGTVKPGLLVAVQYRKRRFTSGPLAAGMAWGGWVGGWGWKPFGGPGIPLAGRSGRWALAVPDETGAWSLSVPDDVPAPLVSPPSGSAEGIFFELRLRGYDPARGTSRGDDSHTVGLDGLDVKLRTTPGGAPLGFTEAAVRDADRVLVAVADGPEDIDEGTTFDDRDDDAAVFSGPQAHLLFSETLAGAFRPPQIAVAAPFTSPLSPSGNPEYAYLLGLVMGSRPGHAFIAAATRTRPQIVDLAVDVRGRITADAQVRIELCFEYLGITLVCT